MSSGLVAANLPSGAGHQGRFGHDREGHPEKALHILGDARELGFSLWTVESALAEAYLGCGEGQRAVEVARRASEEAPDVPEVHYLLGRMLWHDDQAWEALEHVVRFREHRPTDVDAMLLHASVLGYQGDLSGHARLYELSRDVVRPLVRDGLPEAIAIDGQALGHLGRWDSALTAARRLLREPDDSGHWRHSAWHVVKAALDGSLDDPERESIVERAIALYGQNEALSEELAVARAIQGDVDGTIAAFRTTPERLHEASPRVRAVVGVAMLTAGRGAEAYALLEPMADEFDGVAVSILVDAAIAAGDIDGALAAYGRLAAPGDAQDRIAELGIRLLESAEAAARAEALAVFANERSGIQAWLLPRSEAIPPARDSGWEGPHRRTSQVLDDVPFGPVH